MRDVANALTGAEGQEAIWPSPCVVENIWLLVSRVASGDAIERVPQNAASGA
jgi:hypothetical protein